MGGCQSASDGIEAPKKASFVSENRFKKLEKNKFELPLAINTKMQLASSNGNHQTICR